MEAGAEDREQRREQGQKTEAATGTGAEDRNRRQVTENGKRGQDDAGKDYGE